MQCYTINHGWKEYFYPLLYDIPRQSVSLILGTLPQGSHQKKTYEIFDIVQNSETPPPHQAGIRVAANNSITYQRVPDQRVPDQSVPYKGSRKKGSRSNFGTFSVRPAQFSKCPEGDALNVHKSRMYTNQDIHMGVWDHMKCIPIGLSKTSRGEGSLVFRGGRRVQTTFSIFRGDQTIFKNFKSNLI